MSAIAINIDVQTTLPAEMAAKAAQLAPATLHREIAAPLARFTKSHLLKVNADRPNLLGGRRTNFYAGAARSTTWQADANAATITIEHQGFAQRLHGGKISARPGKALAIPADAEAYGRSPREFNNLRLVVFGQTGRAALVTARATNITVGKRGVKAKSSSIERVLYWLVKSVTQRADRSVLPTDQEYTDNATAHLTRYLDRLLARQGGAA
jgi:hypothetical protein